LEKTVLRFKEYIDSLNEAKVATNKDSLHVIDYTRGYKQASNVRRLPIAKFVDPKTHKTHVITDLDEIEKLNLKIKGKPYMSTQDMNRLFSDEIVIEEKVDGHPVIIIHGGYTFFCESLNIRHTVEYDNLPFSNNGWTDMTVVYEILDGEFRPPYHYEQCKGKWLSRKEKEEMCHMVGAPIVPLVYSGKTTPEKMPELADRVSSFGKQKSEGVVVKNLKKGIFGKFINIEFQKHISDEDLMGDVHPMQKRIKNVRKFS
jgi:hypothetical protein